MKKILLPLFALFLSSCNNHNTPEYAGICLSLDDRSVNEWFNLRDLLHENNVKITFFITQPDSLNQSELNKLKIMRGDGHEIGFHGKMHVRSDSYIEKNGYTDYLDKEINEGVAIMDSLGFRCTSFAYPYGAKYWLTDLLLLQKFDLIRGTSSLSKGQDLSMIDDVYFSFDGERILSAIGFDKISGIDKTMVDKAIERIVANKEVLMLYAHTPSSGNEGEDGYYFQIDLLKYIIQKAKEDSIKFVTLNQLKD